MSRNNGKTITTGNRMMAFAGKTAGHVPLLPNTSVGASTGLEGTPNNQQMATATATKLRGYLQVKHNPTTRRSRLPRKVIQ